MASETALELLNILIFPEQGEVVDQYIEDQIGSCITLIGKSGKLNDTHFAQFLEVDPRNRFDILKKLIDLCHTFDIRQPPLCRMDAGRDYLVNAFTAFSESIDTENHELKNNVNEIIVSLLTPNEKKEKNEKTSESLSSEERDELLCLREATKVLQDQFNPFDVNELRVQTFQLNGIINEKNVEIMNLKTELTRHQEAMSSVKKFISVITE